MNWWGVISRRGIKYVTYLKKIPLLTRLFWLFFMQKSEISSAGVWPSTRLVDHHSMTCSFIPGWPQQQPHWLSSYSLEHRLEHWTCLGNVWRWSGESRRIFLRGRTVAAGKPKICISLVRYSHHEQNEQQEWLVWGALEELWGSPDLEEGSLLSLRSSRSHSSSWVPSFRSLPRASRSVLSAQSYIFRNLINQLQLKGKTIFRSKFFELLQKTVAMSFSAGLTCC